MVANVSGPNGYQELISRLWARMSRVARAVLRLRNCSDPEGHAEEVLQEGSMNALESWDALRDPEHAIITITAHAASKHAAKCRRESPQEIDERAQPLFVNPHALSPVEFYEQTKRLEGVLSQARDDTDRRILDLLYLGYNEEEVAEILGAPSGTVRSRLSRLRRRVAEMSGDGGD